jgi:hypothetical protein
MVGLDLSSRAGIERTAIGVRASKLAGTTGDEGARGALQLAGMNIIDVVAGRGSPATSYLVYKVLGDPHVLGERMPEGRPPLSEAELRMLSTWIAQGAP